MFFSQNETIFNASNTLRSDHTVRVVSVNKITFLIEFQIKQTARIDVWSYNEENILEISIWRQFKLSIHSIWPLLNMILI